MRIRRQPDALARDFLAEVVQVVLVEAAFEKRARVDARRRVSLEIHEIAAVLGRRCAPKMIEADLVERRRRRIARDVAAVLGAQAVRVDDHRHRVPADVRLDAPLDRAIAGILGLLAYGNRVEIGRVRAIRQIRARAARVIDHALEQVVGALRAMHSEHGIDRLEPLLRLLRVEIVAAESDQRQWSCSRHEKPYSKYARDELGLIFTDSPETNPVRMRARSPPDPRSSGAMIGFCRKTVKAKGPASRRCIR